MENLSDETLEWHKELCRFATEEDIENHRWQHEAFKYLRLVDEDSDMSRTNFCESAFRHLDEIDKRSNSTIYIGPGATGESNDKIRLDLKFEPKTSGVNVPNSWSDKGIMKTTYILVVNRSASRSVGRNWTLLEEQVPLGNFTRIDDMIESLKR